MVYGGLSQTVNDGAIANITALTCIVVETLVPTQHLVACANANVRRGGLAFHTDDLERVPYADAAIASMKSFAWTIITTNHAEVRPLPIKLLTLMM